MLYNIMAVLTLLALTVVAVLNIQLLMELSRTEWTFSFFGVVLIVQAYMIGFLGGRIISKMEIR